MYIYMYLIHGVKPRVSGVALYAVATREQRAVSGGRSSDDDVSASVLADLQQKQMMEMQKILKLVQGRVR